MNILKIKSVTRMVGLGLIVGSMSASAALAGPKGPACPFTAKDVDGWYKFAGFDGGSAEVGDRRNTSTCTTDSATFATLEQTERGLGQVVIDSETGETATGINTNKQLVVDVNEFSANGYAVVLVINGQNVAPPTTSPLPASLTAEEIAPCIDAVTTSQSYTRWACSKK